MKVKKLIKAVIFAVVLTLLCLCITSAMAVPEDYRNYQWVSGFYEEPENSLDAVYFGSSTTYTFWVAPYAFKNYGIAVWPYASNSQPFEAVRYLIEEARKTQPDALFIFNINNINPTETSFTANQIHYLTDYMPLSWNKVKLTDYLTDFGDYSLGDRLEFLFPLIRYHTRWNQLVEKDFHYTSDGMKGACTSGNFLHSVEPNDPVAIPTGKAPLPSSAQQSLTELLDYCDAEKINILFVSSPQNRTDTERVEQYNTVIEQVTDRGYPMLNMAAMREEIGLNTQTDYYNRKHTNIHGALKVTDFLAQYLVKEYGFTDKRGEAAYASWEESWKLYQKELAPYVTEAESEEHHDLSLAASALSLTQQDGVRTLTWKAAPGADGYGIYRKLRTLKDDGSYKPEAFHLFKTVKGNDLTVTDDTLCEEDQNYVYAVVPYREENGVRYWGTAKTKSLS